jgi:hypothetical protein
MIVLGQLVTLAGQEVQAFSGSFFPTYVTLSRQRAWAGKGSELLATSGLEKRRSSRRQDGLCRPLTGLRSCCDKARKTQRSSGFSGSGHCRTERVEWAYKPSSVACAHLSGTLVSQCLMRPTRGSCGVGPTPVPKDSPPIRPCSGRGLASRCVSTPLVRSYRTISPLPA